MSRITRGEVGAGTAIFAGRHSGFLFEDVGKVMLIGKAQMGGNGLDGMGGILQEHLGKVDFSANQVSVGGNVVVCFEFPDQLGAGDKQLGTDLVDRNSAVNGFVQFRQNLLGDDRTFRLYLPLLGKLHEDAEQIFAGGLVDLIVVDRYLFQCQNTAHFLQNIGVGEYIGLLQIVLVKNGEEQVALEVHPDLFEGVIFVGVVFMGGAGLQKIDIVGFEGIGSTVYHQIAFAGENEFQNEIGGTCPADVKIGVGISNTEAFNGQGNLLRAVIDIGQNLIFQPSETGYILFSDVVKSGVLFHGSITSQS